MDDFDGTLLTVTGLMGWGILFGDFIGERIWLLALIGDNREFPICVVFTDFELRKFGMEEFLLLAFDEEFVVVGLIDESFV